MTANKIISHRSDHGVKRRCEKFSFLNMGNIYSVQFVSTHTLFFKYITNNKTSLFLILGLIIFALNGSTTY